jgi:glycosyltransferase involved in cell wall biosynthesis
VSAATGPRISIVTASFNQGRFLENAIVSVLEQGYSNLEYFVMDGGSTDESLHVIRKYARHLTYWQSQPDGGQVAAINAALGKATGEVLAFLNSDDFLLPLALQHVADAYRHNPEAVGWVGGGHDVAEDGFILQTRTPKGLTLEDLANWEVNWIFQPSCFFSADAARRVGFLDPQYGNAFDFDFWLRLAMMGPFVRVRQILAAATIHTGTKTLRFMPRMFEEVQAIQRKHGYDALADATQASIERARAQTPRSVAAKLIYMSQTKRRMHPERFVRLPGGGRGGDASDILTRHST